MKKEDADLHERARRLIDAERVESLRPEERRSLEDHLAECEDCAAWAAEAQAALGAFKSASVVLPPGLAALAARRVRERAVDLQQQRTRNRALIAGCALSWAAGVASAPLVWKACAWIGGAFHLPRIVWELGFFAWWFVPAAAVGLVIVWAHARTEREDFNASL